MIIDAHVHVFPPEIVCNRTAFLNRDELFDTLYRDPRARLVTASDLLPAMDADGVDHAVAVGFGWRDPGLCALHNDYLAEVVGCYPSRISVFAAVQPLAGSRAAQEVERCYQMGFRGVGELMPHGQGYDLDDELAMGPVVEVALALGLPLLTHTSEPIGHTYPGKGRVTIESVYRFVQRWPGLQSILAHWGGGLPFYELMPEVAKVARDVYYDTAASHLLYRPDVFRVVAELVGYQKILFGSDYPLTRQAQFIQKVRLSGLTAEALQGVLGSNAERLLGVGASTVGLQ